MSELDLVAVERLGRDGSGPLGARDLRPEGQRNSTAARLKSPAIKNSTPSVSRPSRSKGSVSLKKLKLGGHINAPPTIAATTPPAAIPPVIAA
jgi:hypothetical protein